MTLCDFLGKSKYRKEMQLIKRALNKPVEAEDRGDKKNEIESERVIKGKGRWCSVAELGERSRSGQERDARIGRGEKDESSCHVVYENTRNMKDILSEQANKLM